VSEEKKKESAYQKRKREMNEFLDSDAYKKWSKKIWAEYKKANNK
jgi:hypothetical protein